MATLAPLLFICHVTCQSALQQSPRDKGQDFGPTLWPLLLRNQTSSVCSTLCGGSPTFQQGSQSPVCNSILFVMTGDSSPRRRQSKTRRVLEQPEQAGRQWLVLSHTTIQSNGGQSASLALFCDGNFAEFWLSLIFNPCDIWDGGSRVHRTQKHKNF